MQSMNSSHHLPVFQLSIRSAIAAGLSIALAQMLRLPFPLYAMISAVIVTDLEPSQTRKLGIPRLAGSMIGATVGALICTVLQPGAWEAGFGILAAMLLSHYLGLRDAAKLSGYVCGIVILEHDGGPWIYALYRTIETALGIGAAIAVSLIPRLIHDE